MKAMNVIAVLREIPWFCIDFMLKFYDFRVNNMLHINICHELIPVYAKKYLQIRNICGRILVVIHVGLVKEWGRPTLLLLMGCMIYMYLSQYFFEEYYTDSVPERRENMTAKKRGNTVAEITDLVQPIVEKMGLTLWNVCYVKEGSEYYLRIFIDSDSGVTIDDCENVTRAIDAPLDRLDPIEGNYILEVSSPGVERELVLDRHFDRYLGTPVMVKLIRPDENGIREYKGTLISHDKETITLMLENGSETVIKKKAAVYIKLDDFNIN